MAALVRHFGDKDDSGSDCGLCDWCAPTDALLASARSRPLNDSENAIATWVLATLTAAGSAGDSPSTGKLAREWAESGAASAGDRKLFERVLTALSKGRLISFYNDSFEKDGSVIRFRRVFLSEDGRALKTGAERAGALAGLAITEELTKAKGSRPRKGLKQRAAATQATGPVSAETVAALKAWRLDLARSEKVPAFRILSDRVLLAIAAAKPETTDALMAVHGMGPRLCERFGRDILSVIKA
jgi:superfamily II DNA helicase RecQ